jgi:non-ribosomal peptide synthetase component F
MDSMGLLDSLVYEDQDAFKRFGFGASVPLPFHCVHHAFEHYALYQPSALAVVDFEQHITYSELDTRANCLATLLRTHGVGRHSRVCLLVERSIHMVVGIMAILKAGAAYVPLDGSIISSTSLDHAVRDSEATVVVSMEKFAHRISGVPVIILERVDCSCVGGTCTKPQDVSRPEDSAYVIYTSGMSGRWIFFP